MRWHTSGSRRSTASSWTYSRSSARSNRSSARAAPDSTTNRHSALLAPNVRLRASDSEFLAPNMRHAARKLTSVSTPQVLKIPALERETGLVHGFSTISLGTMGLTQAPDPDAVMASRRQFARVLGIDAEPLTVAGAVHGATVARVGPAALRAMHDEYGSDPAQVKAGIGPGICGACYEVGEEVAGQFDAAFVRPSADGRFLLDLAAANRVQLEAEGVEAVDVIGVCTKESDYLPSHRRAPDGTRFAAIVAIK